MVHSKCFHFYKKQLHLIDALWNGTTAILRDMANQNERKRWCFWGELFEVNLIFTVAAFGALHFHQPNTIATTHTRTQRMLSITFICWWVSTRIRGKKEPLQKSNNYQHTHTHIHIAIRWNEINDKQKTKMVIPSRMNEWMNERMRKKYRFYCTVVCDFENPFSLANTS